MRKFLSSICLLAMFCFSYAQEINYVKGDVIIQTIPEKGAIQSITNDFESINLTLENILVPSMHIYLISFDSEVVPQQEALRKIGLHSKIVAAQNNHIVDLRATTPNDPQYQNQWQYENNGGSGGVVDADIDAELAWDITTGGFTPNGDEIVICVVDDGAFLDHPDYDDNLWVNELETPNNGIDDDGNGFIDDYDGWNAGEGTDNVNANFYSHGNAVAGIIGAQGNNGVGVAGVNWDVKLMIVEYGSGNEAGAIAAYSYPLEMRKLYNATNGAKGAFVVATNSSWGINFGQPSDSPLWCAMYDSMGQVGILSAGATINGNTNVDAEGDLPTGCSSDYLITVTNVWRDDFKVDEAGFGLNTIDIGAFGRDTWTMSDGNPNGYDSFGGTSGATPHVAGAVGLIYAADCTSFASLYETDPAEAALKSKQYIMDGGDANQSLDGITVSGNRLNLFGALTELENDCVSCPAIGQAFASNITFTSATIAFSPSTASDNIEDYVVRYRIENALEWIEVVVPNNILNLDNLLEGTTYEFQIKAVCQEGEGGFSSSKFFETETETPITPNSINDISNTLLVNIFPNPTKDLLTIQFAEFQENTNLEIYDVVGTLIYQNEINSDKKRLNVANLQNGLYIVKLTGKNGKAFSHKFYKQ